MLRVEDAVLKARQYAQDNGAIWFEELPAGVVDRGEYWFLRVGSIGSAGVIIDKSSGRLFVMGSALSQDDMFWGHENGFSGVPTTLRITGVSDLNNTVEFLFYVVQGGPGSARDPHPRRTWLKEQLRTLPHEFKRQNPWLRIPALREIRETHHWFTFEASPEDAA
jgi:hypothetical protein